ncbi:MAG TPA: hypothetical protein VF768_00535 [Holophagaceae bacterium]
MRRFRRKNEDSTFRDTPDLEVALDLLDLQVPPSVVAARLRSAEPLLVAGQVRGARILTGLLALLAGLLAWELAGPRWTGSLAAGLLLLLPVAGALARRSAQRIHARWRALPWDRCVSFLCPDYGLVHLSREALAIEWPYGRDQGGMIWNPKWIGAVRYDPSRHALVVETVKVHGVHSSSWQEHYTFKLPGSVTPGQGLVLADLFHLIWTHEDRRSSAAAKAWLAEHL